MKYPQRILGVSVLLCSLVALYLMSESTNRNADHVASLVSVRPYESLSLCGQPGVYKPSCYLNLEIKFRFKDGDPKSVRR